MAQVSKYRYLLNQYPETVQKEQFRIICHISKRTARYLLQSGLVPCVQSGKKTRNYTIKMKDIVRYLERREIHPEKYKLPPGSYSGTYAVKPLLPESVTTEELRKYYIESFRDIPDIVSTREAAELTGATASTVAKWIRTKKLKALSHGPAFIIPKVNLIDFMASDAYLNKRLKSQKFHEKYRRFSIMESGKIIVVANQKGGVAKTSTVRNLSYALAEMGKKVLVVDFDPQYNLTTSFGVLPTQAPYNTGTLITNLLLDESLPDTNEFIQKIGSVDLIPSSRSLTVAEANLLMTPDSNDYLAALLNPLRLSYDYIIVDTNPSLGSLTINALTAADEVIIPIDPELFALTGLQALVDTIKKIKRKLNPSIEIGGILFTKCNKRTNLYRRTYGQVTKAFQSLPIFNCQIPYTVKVGDANSYGMSVMELEQANPASLAYLELAKEVLANA